MSWKSFLQEEPRLTLPQKWAYQLYLSHFHFGESIGCDRIAFARGWRPWTIIGYYGFMDGIWPQSFDQGHSIASVLICLRNFFSWFPVKEMQLLLRILLWFVLLVFFMMALKNWWIMSFEWNKFKWHIWKLVK